MIHLKHVFPSKENIGTLEERWKAEIGQEVRASWSNQTSPIQIRAAIVEDYAVWFANR